MLLTNILLMVVVVVVSSAKDVDVEKNVSDISLNAVASATKDYSAYESCDCGPHSYGCLFISGELTCYCDEGYAQTNSTPKGKCKECSCGPHGGGKCKFLDGLQICVCEHGMDPWTSECLKPPPCDCGEHGSCRLEDDIKVCDCDNGYKENWGKCKECDCGDGKCDFVLGEKKCTCQKDFVEVNGKCQECDCGENSISCKRGSQLFRNKVCTCKEGYAVFKLYEIADESCKKCDCGSNGVSCSFSNVNIFRDEQTCECKYGSHRKTERAGKKCKECECGPNSLSCRFNFDGERRCECEEGYKSLTETGSYWGDEYCTSNGEDGKGGGRGVSGWRIGTYILAAAFAIIITALVIAIIVNKNMNESSTLSQRR